MTLVDTAIPLSVDTYCVRDSTGPLGKYDNRPFSRCENLNWRARCLLHDDIAGSMRLDIPEYGIDHVHRLSQSLLFAVSTCNKQQARQFKFSHLEKGLFLRSSKVLSLKDFPCGSADSRTRRGSAVFKVNKPARNVSAERRAAPPQGKCFGEKTIGANLMSVSVPCT